MDADEARRLADRAPAGDAEAVGSYLRHIEGRIRQAARGGRRSMRDPFATVHEPDGEVLAAVRRTVEAAGYTWTDHPDPDPGSRPYTSISW